MKDKCCECECNDHVHYKLEGKKYCPWCLITKIASKGHLFIETDDEGMYDIRL